MDEQRLKGEVEIGPASNVDVFERARHVEHPACMDVEAERVQKPAEVEQIA